MGSRFILHEPIQKQPFLHQEYLKIVKIPLSSINCKNYAHQFCKNLSLGCEVPIAWIMIF